MEAFADRHNIAMNSTLSCLKGDICTTKETIRNAESSIKHDMNQFKDSVFHQFHDTQLKLCALERQAADNTAQLRLENCQNTAAIRLLASQNKAELSKELAHCCCENKALSLSIETQRVRDELAEERQLNLIFKIKEDDK